jgi:hypothetical protein
LLIGKRRWEVSYLEPDEEAWRKHREALDAHLPFRDFELARPTPDGGKYYALSGLPVMIKRSTLAMAIAIAAPLAMATAEETVAAPVLSAASAQKASSASAVTEVQYIL